MTIAELLGMPCAPRSKFDFSDGTVVGAGASGSEGASEVVEASEVAGAEVVAVVVAVASSSSSLENRFSTPPLVEVVSDEPS